MSEHPKKKLTRMDHYRNHVAKVARIKQERETALAKFKEMIHAACSMSILDIWLQECKATSRAHIRACPRTYTQVYSEEELQDVSACRVGIILRIRESSGYTYILNRSNRNYLSDIGGGVKKRETWQVGLSRELTEETPWIKEYILRRIHVARGSTWSVHFWSGVQCFCDSDSQGQDAKRSVMFIIDHIPKHDVLHSRFKPTEEVQELVLLKSYQLLKVFDWISSTPGVHSVNNGILMLKALHRQRLIDI